MGEQREPGADRVCCWRSANHRQCVRTEGQPLPSADSGVFDENMVARCDFAMSRCQSDDNWNTLQPSLPVLQRAVSEHPHAAAAVRVGRRHLRVRAERAVFLCISFLSLACSFSLSAYIDAHTLSLSCSLSLSLALSLSLSNREFQRESFKKTSKERVSKRETFKERVSKNDHFHPTNHDRCCRQCAIS